MKKVIIYGLLILLCSCCPKLVKKAEVKPEEKEKPEIISILEPTPQPTPQPKPPKETEPVKPPDKEEIPEKKEEIPVTPIPKDKKFVRPEEISPELAEIFKNIYFDFDKYNIRSDAEKVLIKIADYMIKNPDLKILIEGHCDERGTREYNLVLGEQRALSTRNFLIRSGVSPKRMYTISYGEDMPADPRSNEEAWAKNRRCEFKIEVEK